MKLLLAWLVSLALLTVGSTASALQIQATGGSGGSPSQPLYDVTIDAADVGASFSLDWLMAGPAGGFDLSATADITINSFTKSTLELAISITNSTVAPPGTNAGIASLGIGTGVGSKGSMVTAGSVFDDVGSGNGRNLTFPGGFKGIDVCVFAQGCSGGGQQRLLAAGGSDAFTLALSGDYSGGSVTLSSWALKFQTSFGSFELPGRPPRPPQPVPEPAAALVFASGLLVIQRCLRCRAR